MYDHYYAVIMAGGGGTRLWPLSRQSRPKQMLKLLDDRSLFQIAIDRLEGVFPVERILVVTVAAQAAALQEQYPNIPVNNFLIEPLPRGTASVVGLAAIVLRQRDPQAVMAILTADHFIGDEKRFRDLLNSAYAIAQQNFLVTLGIEPTYPATGFGYIHQGEALANLAGLNVYKVLQFKEKPELAVAQEMIASGEYSWNSGMFAWRVDRILAEFANQMPQLSAVLAQIAAHLEGDRAIQMIAELWPGLKNETIDYGIMENAQQAAVIAATGLGWNDVGSWESLFEMVEGDEHGNIVRDADFLGIDTASSLIIQGGSGRKVVTIGVNDLIVVDTQDALLICHKDQAQRIRQVVEILKKQDSTLL